jgi:hypothetical protein
MNYIGYHTVTVEGVDGLSITDSSFDHDGNFMDLEVDSPCSAACVGTDGEPVNVAYWNVTVDHNVWTNTRGTPYWIESEGPPGCIPQKNWTFTNNQLDPTTETDIVIQGSYNDTACPGDGTGLNISNNTGLYPDQSPCGGSIITENCPLLSIGDWGNVIIEGNHFSTWDGAPTYYPNTPNVPGAGVCGVAGATVKNNTFDNAYAAVVTDHCMFASGTATTGLTECGNTYWLTQPGPDSTGTTPPPDPKTDGACG